MNGRTASEERIGIKGDQGLVKEGDEETDDKEVKLDMLETAIVMMR